MQSRNIGLNIRIPTDLRKLIAVSGPASGKYIDCTISQYPSDTETSKPVESGYECPEMEIIDYIEKIHMEK